MLKTIDRYVIREIVPPFLLALLIFTFILVLPPIMEQLEKLVAKGVQLADRGLHHLDCWCPQALGLTIPMALLVGLLVGLGRMSADRESVALLACGVSPYRLLRPVWPSLLVAARRHVRDDRGDPGREPALPGGDVRDHHQAGGRRDPAPGVLTRISRNWVLYPQRRAGPGESGWRNLLVANTSRPEQSRLPGPARPAWSSTP